MQKSITLNNSTWLASLHLLRPGCWPVVFLSLEALFLLQRNLQVNHTSSKLHSDAESENIHLPSFATEPCERSNAHEVLQYKSIVDCDSACFHHAICNSTQIREVALASKQLMLFKLHALHLEEQGVNAALAALN